MATLTVKRRTFEAKRHAPGSPERAAANKNPLTSEYYTGTRYLLVCTADDGSVAWTQGFRTKKDAERIRAGLIRAAS